jgi:hypothetical protein
MIKRIPKKFKFPITAANTTVSLVFELEKTIVSLRGLKVSGNYEEQVYYRGTQRIEINGDEIIPDDYDSKELMSTANTPVNERHYDLGGMKPGNGLIKIDYVDADDGRTVFTPYVVVLLLDCMMDQ